MLIILSIVKNWWREGLIAALAIAVAALLNKTPPSAANVETTSERVVYKDRVVTVQKLVTVDRFKTVTVTKPDGTKIVSESHSEIKTDTHSAESQKSSETEHKINTPIVSEPYRYSASVAVKPKDLKAVVVDVGARLGNLPLQGIIGYDIPNHDIRVGIRVDF